MKRPVICRQLAVLTVVACNFIASWFAYSQVATAPEATAEDKSFYLSKPVVYPEELSGIWEVLNGHGGAIGIHLILDTTVSADAVTLVGVEQAWLDLQVGIYQRAGTVLQFGEENFFSDSPRGGSVRYDDGRLRLHAPEFDLDLLHTSGDRWSGRIHRKGFDSAVILTRPSTAKSKPWFVGTWKTGDQSHQRCIHIAEQAPDEFVGWTDSLTAWGHARFGPHVPKPPYSLEIYGDLVKVSTADDGNVSIELNTFGGTCCSHLFVGIPKDNGTVMKAVWPPGPNQAPHRTEWKKMPGNTCIVTPPDLPSPPRNSDSRDPKK